MFRLSDHKAKALFLIGVIFVLIGAANFSTYTEIQNGKVDTRHYEAHFSLFGDLRVWAGMFIMTGVVAVVSAFIKKYFIGFFATMFMSTWWSGLFAASLFLTGYAHILPNVFIWALVSTFLYIISSWPELYSLKEVDRQVVASKSKAYNMINKLEKRLEK